MNRVNGRNLKEGLHNLRKLLLTQGYSVITDTWQAESNPPEFHEILFASLVCPMASSANESSVLLSATQPWANMHFDERVSGKPLNPPPSHTMWLKDTDKYLSDNAKFSHSYPERIWPDKNKKGIRFNYGDLNDAVKLLKKDSTTRQCYIPIWYPEDITASLMSERVPCTFGWHFMLRGDQLHCFYPMRSCDALRHLQNDLYFANRLCLWLIEKSKLKAKPGYINFTTTSLHCFKLDLYTLKNIVNDYDG
jgi:thymidylate synthase|tara:strand:+ start:2192 stop:2941 length:750 start_codon:yes stop_codon:yes gene_type:complete